MLIPNIEGLQSALADAQAENILLKERLAAYDRASKEPVASCSVTDGRMDIDGFGEYAHTLNDGTHALFTAPPLPVVPQTLLRELVDVVWQEAKESTEVPSTKWADELIGKVFPAVTMQDAVAWRWFDGRGYNSTTDKSQADELVKDGVAVEALGPLQALPVVPDEMSFNDAAAFILNNGMANEDRATIAMRVYNHCRAAMLDAAPQPSESS
ncbi:hypothetical protein [Pectobacterium aroidearum]|uniref:hypothetical protein n=1 Tax=Pectobacterium aroidearum TaxID=1201031 RepID=UPI0030193022